MRPWKTKITFFVFLVAGLVILSRLAYYQILKHDYYSALAQGQQTIFQSVAGERGEIFLRGGQVLATNITSKYAMAVLKEVESLDLLSDVLELEHEEVLRKANNASFVFNIKNNISEEEEIKLKEANIPGVYVREERRRFYPQEFMASQVVGFFGGEGEGQYGAEGYYEDILRGKEALYERRFLMTEENSLRGGTLFLTLDYNIQFKAESLLEEAYEDFNIEGGSIVVMNPKTGAIMAMANFPAFDPNNYSTIKDISVFKNPSTQRFFEPGSVSKAITIAAAINEGKIAPDTEYYDTGEIRVGGHTLKNYLNRSFGKVNDSVCILL